MIKDKFNLPLESEIKQVLKLGVKELPSFPPVMAKLLEICNDENASIIDLSKVVETDPGISAKVLSIANHALVDIERKLTDISEAVTHLGFDRVRNLSLEVMAFEKIFKSKKQRQFDRIFFWRHCLCVASLSMAIAEEIQYPKPGEAYIAGLLHDFGKIIFDLQGRVDYSDFITHATKYMGQLTSLERSLMGMGHDDLGAYYSNLWDLPVPFVLAIKCHHQRFDHLNLSREARILVSIVSLSNFLAWTQGIGSIDIIRPPILQPEIEKNIDLNTINFIQMISKMDQELNTTSKFYNFTFPSPRQFRENLLKANLKLCSINTIYYYFQEQKSENVDISKFKNSITTPHRSLDAKEIITSTLDAIHKDFGFSRLYVMKVLKNQRSLNVVEFFDNTPAQMDLKAFEIPINKSAGGFVQCLRHQEPVIISGRNTSEKKVLDQFKITEMIIVPICSLNKVVGILGMDNIGSGAKIAPDIFSAITMVANELGMALENAGVYREAKAISLKDGLTGLLNRTAINGLLSTSFRKAVDGENALSLVMIDVDHFKKFNDQFGHLAGDNVLKLIATTLKKLSRPFDHVGRYGGEEFIVILNNTELPKALAYAERIRRQIEQLGTLLTDRFPGLSLTVSAGVAQYSPQFKNQDAFIATVDKALYRAKETGRNKVAS